MSDKDRNFFRLLSPKGPYRFNPNRAKPPRILVAPKFHAMYSGLTPIPEASIVGFQTCLAKLSALYPVVTSGFMEGGHMIKGGFRINTIWSEHPEIADVIIVKGPGDTGNFGQPYFYEQTRDEMLLADLIPIEPPYVS